MAEDYSNKSLFNEAGFIIQRLNKIQDRINIVLRPNPLIWNIEFSCYNYQIWFSDLCSLFNEVYAKLSDDEQKELEGIRKGIKSALNNLDIHKTVKDVNTNRTMLIIDNKTWGIIEDNLDMFEKKIKLGIELHGLGNPDVEGDMF